MAAAAALAGLLLLPAPALAYIGPGAGFAVMSSFLVVFVTLLVVAASVLAWPFRALWRLLRRSGPPRSSIGRLVVIGFDGQDPALTDRFLAEGLLPNFAHLAATGAYRPLQTTYPALSPVAWSSFSTGTHPARHNIFDFLDRDRRTYLPRLSSTRIGKVERFFRLGKYLIPRHRPELTNLRRSTPFWTLLGQRRIWSTILRVPITFPPDNFYGAELSAMCVPDLLGTQGTFLLFTTRPARAAFKEGGIRVPIAVQDGQIHGVVTGPENGFVAGHPPLEAPLHARARSRGQAGHADHRRHRGAAGARPTQRLGVDPVSSRARGHRERHRPLPAARDGRTRVALRVADQPRPRAAGDADLASVLLRGLPRQAARTLSRRSGWPRTPGR